MAEGEELEDKESKTEEPSQKKLEDALEKGQVAYSREVTSFFMLFFLTLTVIWVIPYVLKTSAMSLRFLIENAGNIAADRKMIGVILYKFLIKFLLYLMPIFLIVILSPIISSYLQHGEFIFTGEQLKPQLSRISIIKGFDRLFSVKAFVEFLKSFFKVLLVSVFLYLIIANDIKVLPLYQSFSIGGIINELGLIVNHVLISVSIIVSVIAALDFFYQKYEHYSSMKMTKHEQKEEYKQTEGSPEIKRKIRQLRREQAQKRIKQTVPKATVIITNPEHYAVALKYEPQSMSAPVLVAKGLDLMAQKIKEIAEEHDIPIVQNPPIARALYKAVNIDEAIPVEHYEAVAKIISYVMALKQKKRNNP